MSVYFCVQGEMVRADQVEPFESTVVDRSYPQQVPCPDCGGQAVWDEAGHVPGHRTCTTCGTALSCQPDGTDRVEPDTASDQPGALAVWVRYRVERARFHG